MKKQYVKPEGEIILIQSEDVIMTSGNENETEIIRPQGMSSETSIASLY